MGQQRRVDDWLERRGKEQTIRYGLGMERTVSERTGWIGNVRKRWARIGREAIELKRLETNEEHWERHEGHELYSSGRYGSGKAGA